MKENERETLIKLAEMAKTDNHEALISLCKAITKNILFSAMRIIGNRMDAEDVTQLVLIRVCENINGLKNPEVFKSWLNSIIINETRRYMNRNIKHTDVLNIEDYMDTAEEENEECIPYQYTIKEEDRREIIDIIDRLPARQREAIVLHYYESLSVTETAKVMDVPQPVVSRYLRIAREKIKEEIQGYTKKTGTSNSIALLPIGSLLTQVLSLEATETTVINNTWIETAVKSIADRNTGSGTFAARGRVTKGLFSGSALAVLITCILVGTGLFINGVFLNPGDTEAGADFGRSEPIVGTGTGTVVFSGGDAIHGHLNPTQAIAQTESEYGELTVLGWTIETRDGGVLYSGEGPIITEELVSMRETAEDGEYIIVFSLADANGVSYTMSHNFQIRKDSIS